MVEKFDNKDAKNGNFISQMEFRKKSNVKLKVFTVGVMGDELSTLNNPDNFYTGENDYPQQSDCES